MVGSARGNRAVGRGRQFAAKGEPRYGGRAGKGRVKQANQQAGGKMQRENSGSLGIIIQVPVFFSMVFFF